MNRDVLLGFLGLGAGTLTAGVAFCGLLAGWPEGQALGLTAAGLAVYAVGFLRLARGWPHR